MIRYKEMIYDTEEREKWRKPLRQIIYWKWKI